MLLRWLCFDVHHASCPSSTSLSRLFGKIAQRRNLHVLGRQQAGNTLEVGTHITYLPPSNLASSQSTRHELTLAHQNKTTLAQTHEMALQDIKIPRNSYQLYALFAVGSGNERGEVRYMWRKYNAKACRSSCGDLSPIAPYNRCRLIQTLVKTKIDRILHKSSP